MVWNPRARPALVRSAMEEGHTFTECAVTGEASSGRGGMVSWGFSALGRAVMEAGAQASHVRR